MEQLKEEKIDNKKQLTYDELLVCLKKRLLVAEKTLEAQQSISNQQQAVLSKIIASLKILMVTSSEEDLKKEMEQLTRKLTSLDDNPYLWENLSMRIEEKYPQFFNKLLQRNPSLKNRDLRLCTYIFLGLDNQKISQLLSIKYGSVIKAKHRLKQKLAKKKDLDLYEFLLNL